MLLIKQRLKKLLPIEYKKWDKEGRTYSLLGHTERSVDCVLLFLSSIEFFIFLVVEVGKFYHAYESNEFSLGLALCLFGAYLSERIFFGLFKAFFHKHNPDLADGLAVFFLGNRIDFTKGPHYYYYHSYPYKSVKRVMIRHNLEWIGFFFNCTKIGMLVYIDQTKEGDYRVPLVMVTCLSCVEVLFTVKDMIGIWANSPIPLVHPSNREETEIEDLDGVGEERKNEELKGDDLHIVAVEKAVIEQKDEEKDLIKESI